jgi:hypothetical protein
MRVETSRSVIEAYRRLRDFVEQGRFRGVGGVWDQCGLGTDTFALQGSSYAESCWFWPVSVAENAALVQAGKVLYIGEGHPPRRLLAGFSNSAAK